MPRNYYYNAAGKSLPTVTQVARTLGTSAGLVHWAWKEGQAGRHHRETMQDAGMLGSLTHKAIEVPTLDYSSLCTSTADIATIGAAVKAYRRWQKERRVTVREKELRLVSEEHQFGGTCDLVAEVEEQLTIVDLKTGKGVYEEHAAQLAAYAYAYNESHDDTIMRCQVLHVRDGKYATKTWGLEELKPAWESFLAALQIYRRGRALRALMKREG